MEVELPLPHHDSSELIPERSSLISHALTWANVLIGVGVCGFADRRLERGQRNLAPQESQNSELLRRLLQKLVGRLSYRIDSG